MTWLEDLKAKLAAATPGPWTSSIQIHRDSPITLYAPENQTVGMYSDRSGHGVRNAALIAALRNNAERLIAEVEAARAWLRAENEMTPEKVEENFHRDDLFDIADDARMAFQALVSAHDGEEP